MASVSMELNLNDKQLNQIVQKYICDCYKQANIENRLYGYGTQRLSKKVDQMINDGSLVDLVVKKVSKRICDDIPIGHLMTLVDIGNLNEAIIERVSKELLKKLQ